MEHSTVLSMEGHCSWPWCACDGAMVTQPVSNTDFETYSLNITVAHAAHRHTQPRSRQLPRRTLALALAIQVTVATSSATSSGQLGNRPAPTTGHRT